MRARALRWSDSRVSGRFIWCGGECWPSYAESGARVDRPRRATDSGRPPLWGHPPRRRSSLFKTKFIFLPMRPCRRYEQGFIIQTPLQSLIFQRVCGRHMHIWARRQHHTGWTRRARVEFSVQWVSPSLVGVRYYATAIQRRGGRLYSTGLFFPVFTLRETWHSEVHLVTFLNWLQRVCEFAAEGDAAELRGAAKCCSIVAQPVQRNRRCRAHLCEFAAERVKNRSRCSVIDGHIVAHPAAGPQ